MSVLVRKERDKKNRVKEKKRVWIKEKDLKRGIRNGGMREKTGEEGGVEAWWISKTRVKCTQDSKQGSISFIIIINMIF